MADADVSAMKLTKTILLVALTMWRWLTPAPAVKPNVLFITADDMI